MLSIVKRVKKCSGTTKNGQPCKNGLNCRWHLQNSQKDGEGIREFVSNAAKKVKEWIGPSLGQRLAVASQGPREGPTRRFKEFLEGEGSQQVIKLEVCRKPVESGVKAAMNWLSGGRFNKQALALGYDDVLHSYTIVTLANGEKYVVHKNEVIMHRKATDDDYKYEHYEIKLPEDKNLSLKDLVLTAANTDKGQAASADSIKRFYQYDSRSDNCQAFVKAIVVDSGLIPVDDPRALEIIEPQNAGALALAASVCLYPVRDAALLADDSFDGFLYSS